MAVHPPGRDALQLIGPAMARRGGQRRGLAGARVGEPLFPCGRIVGPLLHFDAPRWWLGREEEGLALRLGEAARDGGFGADASDWVSGKTSQIRILSAPTHPANCIKHTGRIPLIPPE